MLDMENRVNIADFGLSNITIGGGIAKAGYGKSGNNCWVAPELSGDTLYEVSLDLHLSVLLDLLFFFSAWKPFVSCESSPYNGSSGDPFQVQSDPSILGIFNHKQRGYDLWIDTSSEDSPFEAEVPDNDIAALCYEFAHASSPFKLSKSQCYKAAEKASPHFDYCLENKEGN